ncbi:hypothetical protein H0I61_07720 [Yersinia kristensenii]|nr:hypothetical protein [Yersinia kristensenii]
MGSDIEHIKRDISDIRSDLKEFRADLKDIRKDMRDDFRTIFKAMGWAGGIIGTLMMALLVTMAKGFGWL